MTDETASSFLRIISILIDFKDYLEKEINLPPSKSETIEPSSCVKFVRLTRALKHDKIELISLSSPSLYDFLIDFATHSSRKRSESYASAFRFISRTSSFNSQKTILRLISKASSFENILPGSSRDSLLVLKEILLQTSNSSPLLQ